MIHHFNRFFSLIDVRVGFLLLFFAVLTGCKQERHLSYQIVNNYSNKISVNYHDNSHQYGVNTYYNVTVYIQNGSSRIMMERSSETGAGTNTDWFYSYPMYINYIANDNGDTINFNPNVAQYWEFVEGASDSYYILTIDTTSF